MVVSFTLTKDCSEYLSDKSVKHTEFRRTILPYPKMKSFLWLPCRSKRRKRRHWELGDVPQPPQRHHRFLVHGSTLPRSTRTPYVSSLQREVTTGVVLPRRDGRKTTPTWTITYIPVPSRGGIKTFDRIGPQ